MDNDSLDMDTRIPSLSNILPNCINICSNIIIIRDGKVQSYCDLKLTNIHTQASGRPPLPNNTNAEHPRIRATTKIPKRAALTSAVSEVVALITNDFGDRVPSRDIVVDNKVGGPKRISELHPSYMALHYPLLSTYREDGFHEKIPYHSNRGTRKIRCGYVSMKEYYAYVIQQRNGKGNTLLKGGCLYQQYLVDAYMAVEKQRLQWTRNNQGTLRVDLYHNLNDAFTRGDTNAKGLGKQIVLPKSFTEVQDI
ncbi:ATP-dependent DNA helicase PIF1-like protein [Tanacetum coccineum]